MKGLVYDAATFLRVHDYAMRWADAIAARPAAARGREVNRLVGEAAHTRQDRGRGGLK